jgi:hypothetical protein
MDMILKICKLILKQERNFQTKKVIDWVYKDLGWNDMTLLMSHPWKVKQSGGNVVDPESGNW